MGRSLRPLDPTAGPVQAFAAELRALWADAGSPTFTVMARRSGASRTALSEATGGDHLPRWDTVAAFVRACGSDPRPWLSRWEAVRDQVGAVDRQQDRPAVPASGPTWVGSAPAADVVPADVVPADGPTSGGDLADRRSTLGRWRLRRPAFVIVAAVLVTAVVSAGVALVVAGRGADPVATSSPRPPVTVVVQNKVAVGADQLIEDSSPSYLSSRPVSRCANRGCKIPGTDLYSDAVLVVDCAVTGASMSNYNLDASESRDNLHRVTSALWYRASYPDGRTGYISEVYLTAGSRGGLGLPTC